MFGLGLPFFAVIGILVLARIAIGAYIWWSFKRLRSRMKEIEQQ